MNFNIGTDRRGLVSDVQNFKIGNDAKNWVQARQFEGEMRTVVVNVMEGTIPLNLTGTTIWFEGLMSDGKTRIIDAKHGTILSPTTGQFRFEFPYAAFATFGSYKQSFFKIVRDGKSIATLEFTLDVLVNLVEDGIVPLDYITPFQDLYEKLEVIYHNADADIQVMVTKWQQQITELITGLNADYASIQTTVNGLIEKLDSIAKKIEDGGLITQLELDAFKNALEDRLSVTNQKITDVDQNSFKVNDSSDLAKMKVLTKFARTDKSRVFQGAAFDSRGNIYLSDQTDSAGSQQLNKYDKTGKLLISRDLKVTDVTWLEGNSLMEDGTGGAKFIIPIDVLGHWVIYDFDADTKSEVFKLDGVPKYCVDNTGKYFITAQTQYNNLGDVNGTLVGFNVYDLSSILAFEPKIVNFIPVKDSVVRGGNKLQGFQMIDDYIYLGRGKVDQWFRATVINSAGILVADFNFDKADLTSKLGLIGNPESEGFSFVNEGGKSVPVMAFLSIGTEVEYVFVKLGVSDGQSVAYTAGASMASILREENLGTTKGLTFIGGGALNDESILVKFNRIKEVGTYNFTAMEGNLGLAPEMASSTGTVVVRQMEAFKATKIAVTAVDYRNNFWTIYYDGGKWSRWSKLEGRVPLWKGSSTLTSQVILNKPITPYNMIGVLYQTSSGQINAAYGTTSISINTLNSDNTNAAVSIYESVMTFPSENSAIVSSSSVISLTGNAAGDALIKRINQNGVTIIEIWGVV